MTRRVCLNVKSLAGLAFAVLFATAGTAMAQTVVLDAPVSEVVDGFIRAGQYASTVNNNGVLATKANFNPDKVRRSMVKFDTENRIASRAQIQSATLTLTLKSSEADTRTLSAYRVSTSFDEATMTWTRRKTGYNWTTAGGDLGSKYAEARVGTAAGTKVTFDVTRLVQETVNGQYGSRYTRIAIVDAGATSAASLKEFHSSQSTDASARPVLTVVLGSTPPPPPPTPASTTTLKVLHWNIHYGFGTDGVYGVERHANWIAQINPDIISLNEVEYFVPGHGNEDQPAKLAALLKTKTGRTWYYHHAQRYGQWGQHGGGNLILSRFPIDSTADLYMSCGDRSAGLVSFVVSGKRVNFISTHLDSQTESCRDSNSRALAAWAGTFAENRIIAGDFNEGLVNVENMGAYEDGWTAADAIGAAVDFPGNSRYGATHDYKIDFVFRSRNAGALSVKAARVYDTRDANGVRPSDHKPLLVTWELR
jgi:endonuclease/exonuclease/phosphatase family metal-dependent hydrolase